MPKDPTRARDAHTLNCAERRADNPALLRQARLTVAIALEKGLLTLDDLHNAAAIVTGSGQQTAAS
jgi:hypothetical protein